MAATDTKPREHYFPTIERIRHLAVYPPAVPLQCVNVWIDEGAIWTEDEPVLGIQATASDLYRGPRTPLGKFKPEPRSMTDAGLADAGYHPEPDQCVDHLVVILTTEDGYPAPRVLDFDAQSGEANWTRVLGPAAAPEEWWARAVAVAAETLRRRAANNPR